jgi:hypothetical protein
MGRPSVARRCALEYCFRPASAPGAPGPLLSHYGDALGRKASTKTKNGGLSDQSPSRIDRAHTKPDRQAAEAEKWFERVLKVSEKSKWEPKLATKIRKSKKGSGETTAASELAGRVIVQCATDALLAEKPKRHAYHRRERVTGRAVYARDGRFAWQPGNEVILRFVIRVVREILRREAQLHAATQLPRHA